MRNVLLKFTFSGFVLIIIIIHGSLLALEVAIYNDKQPAWIDPVQMTLSAEKALEAKGIPCKIVKAPDLVTYMNANKEGIVIMTTGIAPGEIFKNQGDKDLVVKWLTDGGIMFWTGDWPFYYWDAPANCPGAAGEASVFGVTFTQGLGPPGQKMEPTDLGKKLIPSIKTHPSSRPVSLATLMNNKFDYESYADNGNFADPIALRTSKMKGWFVNMHTWPEDETLDQVAKEMAELIKNRFMVMKAVDMKGKLVITWGTIKSN